jgi:serine/threonine protein kinase
MTTSLTEGDIIGGKYRIERVLGAGGMGMVVAARHIKLEQRVAIKLLLPALEDDSRHVARFLREARAAAKLQSEHVARVIDIDTLDSGAPYMVIEYLEGRDLKRLVDDSGPLPVPTAVGYVLEACEAIAEAHAIGIVHRDLKPPNLFLARRADGTTIIKVLDFGISKAIGDDRAQSDHAITNTQELLGSPRYMSPEQLRASANIDARADVWAIGVILYELFAGEPPFRGGTIAETYAAILSTPVTPIRHARPDAPAELEAILNRCLEKDPDKRYATVPDLALALAPFAEGASVQRTLEQITRWATAFEGPVSIDRPRASAASSGATVATATTATTASATPLSPRAAAISEHEPHAAPRNRPTKLEGPPSSDRGASSSKPPAHSGPRALRRNCAPSTPPGFAFDTLPDARLRTWLASVAIGAIASVAVAIVAIVTAGPTPPKPGAQPALAAEPRPGGADVSRPSARPSLIDIELAPPSTPADDRAPSAKEAAPSEGNPRRSSADAQSQPPSSTARADTEETPTAADVPPTVPPTAGATSLPPVRPTTEDPYARRK